MRIGNQVWRQSLENTLPNTKVRNLQEVKLKVILAMAMMISISVIPSYAGVNEFESCRCGSKLATKGDSKQEVFEKCGKPLKVTFPNQDCPELWLYNFGPNAFMQGICFDRKSQVKKVLSLDRGY